MLPLTKVAMSSAAALISSWDLEMVNFPRSSSRTLTDFEFSALIAFASVAAGAIFATFGVSGVRADKG